jgi:hypothetical protein
MKSQIAERSVEAQQAAHVAELEKDNAQLRIELDAARSKLVEVEHREQALTSEYEDLKKYFESMCTSNDVVVSEKAEVEKTERVKLQRFQPSLRRKLTALRRDMEAFVAMLKGKECGVSCQCFCV